MPICTAILAAALLAGPAAAPNEVGPGDNTTDPSAQVFGTPQFGGFQPPWLQQAGVQQPQAQQQGTPQLWGVQPPWLQQPQQTGTAQPAGVQSNLPPGMMQPPPWLQEFNPQQQQPQQGSQQAPQQEAADEDMPTFMFQPSNSSNANPMAAGNAPQPGNGPQSAAKESADDDFFPGRFPAHWGRSGRAFHPEARDLVINPTIDASKPGANSVTMPKLKGHQVAKAWPAYGSRKAR